MVVDDDENIVKMIKILLDQNHFQFISSVGERVISDVKEHKPDLIILDIMMPNVDGFTVCKLLKENKSTSNIPIVFMSAKDHIKDKIVAMKCGAVDYIIKPFNPFVLEEIILRNIA